MATKTVTPMNDIVNVNNIKSSKLFKKFLETEQSEENTYLKSGENTMRGFQESPFKKQNDFSEKELENILRGSQIRNGQRQSYNPYQDSQNLNISVTSEQSNFNPQSGFNQLQHSYFQPPTPQYIQSSDNHNITQSPNLSQQILDTHKKQSMSPERFYFNPPALPLYNNNNQTIIEDDQEMQQQSEQSQNQTNSNQKMQKSTPHQKQSIPQMNSSIKQTPIQQNQYDQYLPHQYAQSYDYPVQGYSNQKFVDENSGFKQNNPSQNQRGRMPIMNSNNQQIPQIQQIPQSSLQQSYNHLSQNVNDEIPLREEDLQPHNSYSVKPRMMEQQNYDEDERVRREQVKRNNYQNVDYFDDSSSNHNKNTDKKVINNNNLFKNSKSNLMNMSHETKNFEKDLKQFQQQISLQEEQISHIQISLEKEQLKNKTLSDTISELRRKIDSLEVEKTEIRSRLLCETEKNVREVQQQTSQVSILKLKVTELEKREEQLKQDNDKQKQNLLKEETNKQKLEDEIKEHKNKISEMVEAAQEHQRRQERRDDEIIQLKLQNEQLKAKLASISLNHERNSEKLTENQRQQFRDVEEREENIRKIAELQQKVQNYLIESERLKNENYNLNRQLHDSNFRNELIQNDLFNQKQMLLEKNQKENILQVNIDKANMEVHQLRNLLSRTELEMRDVKEHNNHLIRSITDIASQKSVSEQNFEQGQYSKSYYVPSASITPNPATEQPNLASQTIPGYRTRGQLEFQTNLMTPPKSRSLVQFQKADEDIQKNQIQSYRRGRMANELDNQGGEEEVKTNSPNRLRFKPQDHNIFGASDAGRFQPHSREYSWSPAKKAEIQKPRDHNIFGQPADETYQRNPQKIGHSSLSPQRTYKSNPWDDMPPAGMRKRSPRNNPLLGTTDGFDQIIETGGKSKNGNSQVATLEDNLMLMNQDRQMLDAELRKLEDMKRKSGADLRRKAEVSRELEQLEAAINQHKLQLRQIGVL